MTGLPRGFRRGLLVGGAIAFLWALLGNRRRRTSIAAQAIGRLEAVPFPATRVYSWAAGRLMRDVYRAVAEDVVSEARSGELLELGDARDIPFEDGSFNFVASLGGLHSWAPPEPVLGEVHRVLKRGGRAWIYDLRRETSEEAWDVARSGLPAPLRPLFDVGIMGSWRWARTEGEIAEIVARSPFKRAELQAMEAEIGDVALPALTRVALKK